MIYDSVIVGAGPAGITCAIYLKRANLNCLIIEKDTPGGQVVKTSVVENYPGFVSISGPDLASNFYKQIKELNVPYKYGEVKEITDGEEYKTIKIDNEEIKTKTVILAVGRRPKSLNDESEGLLGKGVSYCSLCDGALYKNQDVAIIGGGNSALEESLHLATICKSVSILNRSNSLKGDKLLIDKVYNNEKINVYLNAEVEKFNKNGEILESLDIKTNGEISKIDVKACFIFIGYEPATSFLSNLDILDEKGYIEVDSKFETKVSGIYACGDVVKKDAYQIATAVGEGALCAVSCIKKFD